MNERPDNQTNATGRNIRRTWGSRAALLLFVAGAGAAFFGGAGLFLQQISGSGTVLVHGSVVPGRNLALKGEDIREGDVGAILGWGFAPCSGGPLSWLDSIGTPYAAERCDQLAEQFGARFATPALLRDMADKGQEFYKRFGSTAKAA